MSYEHNALQPVYLNHGFSTREFYRCTIPRYSWASELIKPCTRCILTRKNYFALGACSSWHHPARENASPLGPGRFRRRPECRRELLSATVPLALQSRTSAQADATEHTLSAPFCNVHFSSFHCHTTPWNGFNDLYSTDKKTEAQRR